MPKVAKMLRKRRRRGIGYDISENVYYIESRSRKDFYHEVQKFDNKWACNCEKKVYDSIDMACSHIELIVWYLKYQPHMIDTVISIDDMKILRPQN